ncbi:MAG: ABC transporter permease [Candidatus Saccharibacteria bacterium]|nr:ABC transporter permease [Microbacteriaceae bacterium]
MKTSGSIKRRGLLARLRIAVTIARRSSLRSVGTSALIISLIALPIAGMAGVIVVAASMQPTVGERIDDQLGKSQGMLRTVVPAGMPIRQNPFNTDAWILKSPNQNWTTNPPTDPVDVLPTGTRVLPIFPSTATVTTATGVASLATVEGEAWDSSLAGRFDLTSGRAPRSADEVMVSASALTRLGVVMGGSMTVRAPDPGTLTVVGVLEDRSVPSSKEVLFGEVGTFSKLDAAQRVGTTQYFLPDFSLNWAQTQRLNEQGITALSRAVALAPPPTGSYPEDGSQSPRQSQFAGGAILAGFAIFEIVLLAGAAFAVTARKQQRTLAIVASVGANRSTLFGVLSATGVVLGFLGGVAGVTVGVGGAAVFMAVTRDGSSTQYPGFHFEPALLGFVIAFSVLVGWIASLAPAISASKLDVVAALRGSRRPPKPNRRRPIAGLVVLVAGTLATVGGGAVIAFNNSLGHSINGRAGSIAIGMIVAGPIVAQVGLMLCGPLILRLAAWSMRRIGLGARLAIRDSARNPSRAVPAFAAILTTVFVAVFAMSMLASFETSNASNHQYSTVEGQVSSSVTYYDPNSQKTVTLDDPTKLKDAMRSTLNVTAVRTLSSVRDSVGENPDDYPGLLPSLTVPDVNLCPSDTHSPDYGNAFVNPSSRESLLLRTDPRCANDFTINTSNDYRGHIWVGDRADLALVLGHAPSAASTATLSHGGAVSLHAAYVNNGALTIDWWTANQVANAVPFLRDTPPKRSETIPATVEKTEHPINFGVFISPSTAKQLGLEATPSTVLATLKSSPSDADLDAARQATAVITGTLLGDSVTVETGPNLFAGPLAWGLLGLAAILAIASAAVAIGLARFDGRADDATLASVGARGITRRSFAFWQALVICALGSLLGSGLGILPAFALGLPGGLFPFTPPWTQIALAAIALPLVIALGSWVLAARPLVSNRRMLVA